MWKLELKDKISFYVHIFYLYHCIVLLVIPFLIGVVFKMNAALYILGYGVFYLLGFYFLSWIIVPFLLLIYKFLYEKLGLVKSSIIVFSTVCMISIWGYDFFNFSKSDEGSFLLDMSTTPLFLWILFLIKEHSQSTEYK